MKRTHLTVALLALCPNAWSQLVTGDVQIVAFSTKNPKNEQLAFVPWTDLAAGTQVHFTSSGFFSDGTLRDSEDSLTWTAPAGGLAAGTIVTWNGDPAASPPTNFGSVSGTLVFTEQDDQVFAGSLAFPNTGDTTAPGTTYSGNLLHGLNIGTAWDATAIDDDTSALPGALSGALDNFVTPSDSGIRNGEDIGPRTGLNLDSFRAAIDDPNNWAFSQGANFSPSVTSFSIAIPEPSAVVPLGALLGAVFVGHRRRRPTLT